MADHHLGKGRDTGGSTQHRAVELTKVLSACAPVFTECHRVRNDEENYTNPGTTVSGLAPTTEVCVTMKMLVRCISIPSLVS